MHIPVEKVRKIQKIAQEPISLETPIGEEDSHLGDFIEDKNIALPTENAVNHSLEDTAHKVLATLTGKALRASNRRALDHTLEEVGQDFDVTRERFARSRRRLSASCVTRAAASDSRPSSRTKPHGLKNARARSLDRAFLLLQVALVQEAEGL